MNEIIIKHEGFLNYSLLNKLLSEFIQYVNRNHVNSYVFRKVQIVMVELLENNYQYVQSIREHYEIEQRKPEFYLIITPYGFKLVASNPVAAKDADELKKTLDNINNFDLKILKEQYKKTLKERMYSDKPTAGIGLLRIAKVTKNKIKYSFRKIDNNLLYYTLEIMVNPK